MKSETEEWVLIAEQDIGSARSLLEDGFVENAAYFCQQAVEKVLKAILTEAGTHFPRVHDLAELADLGGLDCTDDQRVLLNRLTDHASRSRYPGAHYNQTEIEGLLRETEELYKWLRLRLS